MSTRDLPDDGDAADDDDGETRTMMRRTPVPSSWQHIKTLMHRNMDTDRREPKQWLARFVGIGVLMILYNVGFFLSYEDGNADDSSKVVGDYRIHAGRNWTLPKLIRMAGSDVGYVNEVGSVMEAQWPTLQLNYTSITNSMLLQEECSLGRIADEASQEVCVFIDTNNTYSIFYGGKEISSPFQFANAGAQYAINAALLEVANANTSLYLIDTIQETPELLDSDNVQADLASILVPSAMLGLSAVIMTMFLIGPIVFEKLNGIAESFINVGVTMRSYMLQWIVYYSLNGIVTAFILTAISIFYRLFPQSSGLLIFFSHYLALVHIYALWVVVMQFVKQEELAQGLPWLVGIPSLIGAIALVIFDSPNSIILTILTAISPYVGMIQYSAVYITYDATGFGTGIHPGENVVESGLLGNMMAQLCGIVLCLIGVVVYSTPSLRQMGKTNTTTAEAEPDANDDEVPTHQENFESLAPGSDILMSVDSIHHTYRAGCFGKAKPTQVLKGLSLQVCRGEVFGYLGHNGSGKSSSVGIFSGELQLQEGNVTYHFRQGDVQLSSFDGAATIRTKIGVCPQHNTALQEKLTCRETLRLFANLKGGILMGTGQTTRQAVESEVERRLEAVKFTSDEDSDKPVGSFSGGMKRKVLIAIALLGDPECVFLDEPTAGLDPYNRRLIWDMIIEAKKGRSIILTTHFLDEADILSDRIGILKDGKLITCGSSLFLKHHFGVGYSLNFDSESSFDVSSIIDSAAQIPLEKSGTYKWSIKHGHESRFPDLLRALNADGATNVDLELTTLEEVFLATGTEDLEEEEHNDEAEEASDGEGGEEADLEDRNTKIQNLENIWQPKADISPIVWRKKFLLVQNFMMANAMKMKGSVFLNITQPLIYLIIGIVLSGIADIPDTGDLIVNDPIPLSPFIAGTETRTFFGIPNLQETLGFNPIAPLLATEDVPQNSDDYYEGSFPVLGGYLDEDTTLQFSRDQASLQIGTMILSNYTAFLSADSSLNGIVTTVQQLPYVTDAPFRIDFLLLPLFLSFGFAGLAFSVLDVLLLKGDNIISLFQVAGITEWTTYLGVSNYKLLTTFCPFFVLVIILGLALKVVIMGSAGRWLGTILVMLGYAYSTAPLGLIFGKRFIHGDFKSASNWFPGVYMTFVGLPYVAWNSALQAVPDARDVILIIGDVLCIVPQFAFQRGLAGVIEPSSKFDDPTLTWGDIWKFETRIWFTIVMMFMVGSFEWWYLLRLTTTRDPKTKLTADQAGQYITPMDISHDPDLVAERDRSRASDDGLNARDLVKVFSIKPTKDSKSKEPIIKKAVKGVSYGIRKNEIFALLGPNGAGKSVTMSMLAGQLTPDNGDVTLDGRTATGSDRGVDHLFDRCNISYCPQFDALFPRMTVAQHLQFYAQVRGLNWEDESTKQHIEGIIRLLGLEKHREKESTQLSGGYKRRLSLGLAMIGYPKIMMVDEATTGLDPGARRLIWNVLKPSITHDHYDIPAMLLSSHYMDECEELGTRIGIMIDGELVSTGSLKRLQELYCTSYFVEISLKPTATDDAEQGVMDAFSENGMEASVYESLPFHFKLQVPIREGHDDTSQLAHIFDLIESNKERLDIKFYSVALMSLEQIFINLSRKQFEADTTFESQRVV